MSFLKEINDEFQKEVFWISLFDILFFIAPGFLVLFIFYRDLFISLDAIKLILLALSISVPFVVLNAIFVGLLQSIYAKTKNSEDNMFICATISLFFTNIFFDITILTSYFFSLSLKTSLILIIFLEILFSILMLLAINQTKKQKIK